MCDVEVIPPVTYPMDEMMNLVHQGYKVTRSRWIKVSDNKWTIVYDLERHVPAQKHAIITNIKDDGNGQG